MIANHADFKIVQETPDKIFLVDLDRGNVSVTNDAEHVCAVIWRHQGNKRIIYRDSAGAWDELVHDHGIFQGFAPYLGVQP